MIGHVPYLSEEKPRLRNGRFCVGGTALTVLRSLRMSAMRAALLVISVRAEAHSMQVRIADAATCGRCRIEIEKTIDLANRDYSFGGQPTAVEVDARGRLWVAIPDELTRIYTADGRFLATLGKKGNGPGEYAGPYGLARIPPDSMLVLDNRGNLAFVVNISLTASRFVRLPALMFSALVINWPHEVVSSGSVLTPAAAGWPLHSFSFARTDALLAASFGYEQGTLRPNFPTEQQQRLANSKSGAFWSADMLRYRFSKWTKTGELQRTYLRTPEWFSKASTDWIGNPQTPPPPRVLGLHEATDGLLWVYLQVAAPNWKEGWPKNIQGSKEVSSRSVRFDKLFATTIEIVDPRTGTLVAARTIPALVVAVLRDGRVATYAVDSEDEPTISVLRLRIVQ